jgi:hypothetical protein
MFCVTATEKHSLDGGEKLEGRLALADRIEWSAVRSFMMHGEDPETVSADCSSGAQWCHSG